MPTNQQRREAAKRKLERQLVRREERERGRRQRLIIVGAVAAVLVLAGGVWFIATRGNTPSAATSGNTTGTAGSTGNGTTAAPKTPCTYTTAGAGKAVKKASAPTNLSPANTGALAVELTINGQKVPVSLDRKAAPCTVNSFVSLASQGFYDASDCWRQTGNSALNILQCGDPSGKGTGGPGYTFADELTTATAFKAAGTDAKIYPAGTIAMANSGAGTNGSQFFIVYKDSTLAASYTAFGTVSADGMKVIDSLTAKGVKNDAQDGPPAEKITINTVTVPTDSVSATGSYATTAPASGSGAAGQTAPVSAAASSSAIPSAK